MKNRTRFSPTVLATLALVAPFPCLPADTVTLRDGREIHGSVEGSGSEISVKSGGMIQSFAVTQVRSIRFAQAVTTASAAVAPSSAASVEDPLPAAGSATTLPKGTEIVVRTIRAMDSRSGELSKEYEASLDEPLTLNGVVVAPAKSTAMLKITRIKQAGTLKGSSSLSLQLVSVTIQGKRIAAETEEFVSTSSSKGKRTAVETGAGAAGGCALGAVFGGAVGCGVGGAIGGVVGAGASAVQGKVASIPSETRLTFRLTQPLIVGSPARATEATLAAVIANGERLSQAKDPAGALKEYQKAQDLSPASSLASYRAGESHFALQDLQSAANEFRRALIADHNPAWTLVWSHIYMGRIFDLTGQRERAISEYKAALVTGDNTEKALDLAVGYIQSPYRKEN